MVKVLEAPGSYWSLTPETQRRTNVGAHIKKQPKIEVQPKEANST
jgi:hypothetical protein